MTDTTPEELILKAADAIAEYGHMKSNYGTKKHGFCAMGALRYVTCEDDSGFFFSTKDSPELRDLYYQAQHLLGASLPTSNGAGDMHEAIVMFNDCPTTTAEDVILAMKKAANHG